MRELVISADGIKEPLSEIEAMYAAAPSLRRWRFIKFRPRNPMDVDYGGLSVHRGDHTSAEPKWSTRRRYGFHSELLESNRNVCRSRLSLLDGALR